MHIEELHLENFRGFKELTLKFPANLAVIIGVNGSGKSSILDPLSLLLTSLSLGIIDSVERIYFEAQKQRSQKYYEQGLSGFKFSDSFYSGLNNKDINNLSNKVKINMKLDDEINIHPSLELDFKSLGTVSRYGHNRNDYYNFIYQKLLLDKEANIPICVHFRINRFNTNDPDDLRQEAFNPIMQFPQLNAYLGFTAIKQHDFATFFHWFRNQEDIENEERLEVNPEYRDKQLEAVKRAITNLLGNDYINLRVKRTSNQIIVHKKGEELSVSQLSDGEKGLLAMVGDIARRLAIANPSLDDPLKGEGVILIDEIELHLHPQWQRKIIPNLRETFPKCQFIVTTHSPQVLSNVRKENVFIIEDFQLVEHTPHTYGRDSNSILFELMGVSDRIPEVQKQIDSCLQLIDDNELDRAKAELEKLSDLLGEDDSEVVRANTLIDFFHRIE